MCVWLLLITRRSRVHYLYHLYCKWTPTRICVIGSWNILPNSDSMVHAPIIFAFSWEFVRTPLFITSNCTNITVYIVYLYMLNKLMVLILKMVMALTASHLVLALSQSDNMVFEAVRIKWFWDSSYCMNSRSAPWFPLVWLICYTDSVNLWTTSWPFS